MIPKEVVVKASVESVWHAWTTPEDAVTFFAPKANIRLAVGGPYELYLDVDAPEARVLLARRIKKGILKKSRNSHGMVCWIE
jgi:uncharacterized protein YndB with AHSA1/START domain